MKLLLISGACEFRTQSTAGKVRSGSADRSEWKELKSIDYSFLNTTFLFFIKVFYNQFLRKGVRT